MTRHCERRLATGLLVGIVCVNHKIGLALSIPELGMLATMLGVHMGLVHFTKPGAPDESK
jgi:hypothetical protein